MKKLLALMLLLVTVVILAVPTPALAWGGWSPQTAFVGTAQAFGLAPGTITVNYDGPNYRIQTTTDEMVAANVISCNRWPEIAGADILFIHTSRTILNYNTMKITGTATGQILVGRLAEDYSGMDEIWLQGSYSTFIRGDFSLDGALQPIIYDKIFDAARWDLSGANADFAGITANGLGFANLQWTPVGVDDDGNPVSTLAGPMLLTGVYK